MTTWCRTVALLGLLTCAGLATADIAPRPGIRPAPPVVPPGPAKTTSSAVPLIFELDDRATDARIQIPITLFRRAELDSRNPNEGRAEGPRLPTIMVGLCLGLGLTFTGLFLVRNPNVLPGSRLALLLALGAVVVTGAVVWGNAAPPPRPVLNPQPAGDRVVLEIVNRNDNSVRVIVSKKQLEKVLEDAKKAEAPQK